MAWQPIAIYGSAQISAMYVAEREMQVHCLGSVLRCWVLDYSVLMDTLNSLVLEFHL